ncbi:MAG TPA: PadR family transcriptional regulator [Acidimicrobiales bacterium]|nr:PadR family transcriptional regulator [Acidimicrobiales bacterium]
MAAITAWILIPILAFATDPRRGDLYGELHDADLRSSMKRARLNRSAALGKILELLIANPDREFRAIDFTHEADLSPGSVHPILDKLHRAKVIEVIRRGEPAPASIKTYRLTDLGARFALRYKAAMGVTV